MATDTPISKEQFEDWLYGICPVFYDGSARGKSYYVPLSEHVHISLFTRFRESLPNKKDHHGRIFMRLESRVTNRRLSRTGVNNKKVDRTRQWRVFWKLHLNELMDAYEEQRDVIEKDTKESHDDHVVRLLPALEAIRNWKSDVHLKRFHKLLKQGKWLTPHQEGLVLKSAGRVSQTGISSAVPAI